MNLVLFTIELERSGPSNRTGPHGANRDRPRATRRLRWVLAAVAGAVCAAAMAAAGWILAGGDTSGSAPLDWLPISTASASTAAGGSAQVQITSDPDHATVVLDGKKRGETPISMSVATGPHTLVLADSAALDSQRQLTVNGDVHLDVSMVRRRPSATQLKPAYPGATIAAADFLADGRLALSMALPGHGTNASNRALTEPWIFDPSSGSLIPFNPASNPRSAIVAVSPDATRVAYATGSKKQASSNGEHLTEVLVAGAGGSTAITVFALLSATPNSGSTDLEEVHDITWAPDGHHLLVIVRLYGLSGGYPAASRSRVLLVRADLPAQDGDGPLELLTLPAEIVPASYNWAPNGGWVAFLTMATTSGSGGTSFVALCALDIRAGGAVSGFRYVADLSRQSSGAGPLPASPVAWSPATDGSLLYAGPTPKVTVSNPLGLPTTSGGDVGLFSATPTGPRLTAEEGQRLRAATGLLAPTWASAEEWGGADILALARSGQGSRPLMVRGVDSANGTVRNLDVVLPATVGGSGAATARWDLPHGQLLVLAPHDSSTSGLLDYWLVRLRGPAGGGL